MDMLRDMKTKHNRSDRKLVYKSEKSNYNRPQLHDMPYNTNWKYGMPKKPNQNKETPNPLKRTNNFLEDYLWCDIYRLPHAPE